MASGLIHVLLTRPLPESEELATLLAPLGVEPLILPAFDFLSVDLLAEQPIEFERLQSAGEDDLVIFTSPRAVAFGVPQMPADALRRACVHAIGPATAKVLARQGIRAHTAPQGAYTSEALLDSLAGGPAPGTAPRAFIVAAPGGREALAKGLEAAGWQTIMLWVYRAQAAPLGRDAVQRLSGADAVLSVWTSGNTMKALSQRLPPAAWFRVCQGPWLVISERLERLARAYGPARVHRASGPDNAAIVAAVRQLLG
jgi:uroporphyrinogen-III synthase